MADNPTLLGFVVDVSASLLDIDTGELLDNGRLGLIPSIYANLFSIMRGDGTSSSDFLTFTVGNGGSIGSGIFDIVGTINTFVKDEFFKDELLGQVNPSSDSENKLADVILDIITDESRFEAGRITITDKLEGIENTSHSTLLMNKLLYNPGFKDSFCSAILELDRSNDEIELCVDKIETIALNLLSPLIQEEIQTYTLSETFAILQKFVLPSVMSSAGSIMMSLLLQGKHKFVRQIIDVLLKIVKPYIFGRGSLNRSLCATLDIFSKTEFKKFSKYCLVVSTVNEHDTIDPNIIQKFHDLDIKVGCCLIADKTTLPSRTIFTEEIDQWNSNIRSLYQLSAGMPLRVLPQNALKRLKWNVNKGNKTFRLFIQINDADNLKDAVDTLYSLTCCKDSLSTWKMNLPLSEYLEQEQTPFVPTSQKGVSCFVNAAGTVLHMALTRSFRNNTESVPCFQVVKDIIRKHYGKGCTRTVYVLRAACKQYNFQVKEIEESEAVEVMSHGRPTLASFSLKESEWEIFLKFFEHHSRGMLDTDVLDISKRKVGRLYEHSVVFTSFHESCLRFMNSWGSDWADVGFFKVKTSAVLNMKFYDIVTPQDKDESVGKTEIYKLIYKLNGDEYTCSSCGQTSFVLEYTGTLTSFFCPKCKTIFKDSKGSKLCISNYLTSLLC